MLRRRLAKHGYEMIVAEDGQKGIEAALREKPDLILMDLSLPVLTGWEAAQQLKESAQTQAISWTGRFRSGPGRLAPSLRERDG
jgi:CheY-like chemotaxis protein